MALTGMGCPGSNVRRATLPTSASRASKIVERATVCAMKERATSSSSETTSPG